LSAGIFFGFGVHAMLVVQLLLAGLKCWLCFSAAGISLALVSLSVAHDPANVVRMALVLPWSVLVVLAWNGSPRPAVAAAASITDTAAVRLVVFTQPDCAYCDELRRNVLPGIEHEFGSRLEVVYRPAGDLPAIRRTPTIV